MDYIKTIKTTPQGDVEEVTEVAKYEAIPALEQDDELAILRPMGNDYYKIIRVPQSVLPTKAEVEAKIGADYWEPSWGNKVDLNIPSTDQLTLFKFTFEYNGWCYLKSAYESCEISVFETMTDPLNGAMIARGQSGVFFLVYKGLNVLINTTSALNSTKCIFRIKGEV